MIPLQHQGEYGVSNLSFLNDGDAIGLFNEEVR